MCDEARGKQGGLSKTRGALLNCRKKKTKKKSAIA